MSYGKAGNILRKSIIFHLMHKCGMDTCHRCGEKIEQVDQMSIEHIEDWLRSESPVDYFFNMDNITFSHIDCNIRAEKVSPRGVTGFKGVSYVPKTCNTKPYRIQVYADGKRKHSSFHKTAEEAAKCYDIKAKEFIGPKAITNAELGLL
ncbi:Uncharacterised protein [Streptococcus pneumoniae]|nr:Uncharacterised protein [Streptococcus pneumoniae]CJQ05418.1 Uncharacterised protein [Streptococcus pneumoniae]